jgi:inosine-uridine nucleoside N-ribohydrolase
MRCARSSGWASRTYRCWRARSSRWSTIIAGWRQSRHCSARATAAPGANRDRKRRPISDGFAAQTTAGEQHAVEVTIVAIGPATNLALAIRLAPEISGQIRRIIWMGGSFDAMGNVTPAAEFNWWFDPEAVRIVLREPIPQVIVSLDVTNKVAMELEQYRAITEIANPTPITELWKTVYGERFSGPNPRRDIWDTIAVGYLADPDIVTDMRRFFVDVDTNFGPNYGRALGYAPDPDDPETPPLAMLQPADVIYEIDEARFWDKFTDLMTRPVPVAQP